MINIQNQNELFQLVADNLSEDVECIGFGGTAMMYYQFKDSTKDIDLLFITKKDRQIFIDSISKLGYREKRKLLSIYIDEKIMDKHAPLMYVRSDDQRFDLFAERVFQTQLTETMKKRTQQIRDFNGKKRLRIKILSPEDLFILKAVTSRPRDFADLITIIKNYTEFDWNSMIDETLHQTIIGDGWAKLDVEKNMLKLKEEFNISKEFFDRLYSK